MRSVINVSSFWLLTCGSVYIRLVKNCACLPQLQHPVKTSPRMQFCLTSILRGTLTSQCIFWSVQAISGNQPSISVDTVRQLVVFMMPVRWACCGPDIVLNYVWRNWLEVRIFYPITLLSIRCGFRKKEAKGRRNMIQTE